MSDAIKIERLRLGVSACLLGEEVRYNGGHKRDRFLLDTLGQFVDWVTLCPEVEIGLGTPREVIHLAGDVTAPRLVAPKSGLDHTETMKAWAATKVAALADLNLHGFVLKKDSPSCGLFRVKVYDQHQNAVRQGRGLFAAALTRTLPLLPVEEEGRLHDMGLRENFIERIFAYRRWTNLLLDNPTPAGLVEFHTAHKMSLMAHSPDHQRELGRLVAAAGRQPWPELSTQYGLLFMETLALKATTGKHANVLQHLMGYLKRDLSSDDKAELRTLIDNYRLGLVPLVVPLTLLNHHFRRCRAPAWIYQQLYLNPYPQELMLRNHV